jgi:hypothetical protein
MLSDGHVEAMPEPLTSPPCIPSFIPPLMIHPTRYFMRLIDFLIYELLKHFPDFEMTTSEYQHLEVAQQLALTSCCLVVNGPHV